MKPRRNPKYSHGAMSGVWRRDGLWESGGPGDVESRLDGDILVLDYQSSCPELWTPFSEQFAAEGYKIDFTRVIPVARKSLGVNPPKLLIGDFYQEDLSAQRQKLELFTCARRELGIPVIIAHESPASVLRRACVLDYGFDGVYKKSKVVEEPGEFYAKVRELIGRKLY